MTQQMIDTHHVSDFHCGETTSHRTIQYHAGFFEHRPDRADVNVMYKQRSSKSAVECMLLNRQCISQHITIPC